MLVPGGVLPAACAEAEAAPHWELWSGIDATGSSWFAYSGVVYAPEGDVIKSGWRLRAELGQGRYTYDGQLPGDGHKPIAVTFHGQPTSAAALFGYQARWLGTIFKAYAGLAYEAHTVTPVDPGSDVIGNAIGAKLEVETWTDITNELWLATDASYGTAFGDYRASMRAGTRLTNDLTAGLEVGALGNSGYDAIRAGANLSLDTPIGEVTLSGGISGDYDARTGPYAGLSVFARF